MGKHKKPCERIASIIPKGWHWTIYSRSGANPARAVLVSPDFRHHIGVDGNTPDEALERALKKCATHSQ